jgi:hypothetical protein
MSYLKYYAEHGAVKIPEASLASLRLPESVLEFLGRYGVPKRVPMPGEYDARHNGFRLLTTPNSPQVGQYLIFADSCFSNWVGSYFAISQDTGEILQLSKEQDDIPTFVNSSMQQFLECAVIFQEATEVDTIDAIDFDWLKASIQKVDPKAMTEKSIRYYWPVEIDSIVYL